MIRIRQTASALLIGLTALTTYAAEPLYQTNFEKTKTGEDILEMEMETK